MKQVKTNNKVIGNNPRQPRTEKWLEDSLDVIRLINVGEFSEARLLADELKKKMSRHEIAALNTEIAAFAECFNSQ